MTCAFGPLPNNNLLQYVCAHLYVTCHIGAALENIILAGGYLGRFATCDVGIDDYLLVMGNAWVVITLLQSIDEVFFSLGGCPVWGHVSLCVRGCVVPGGWPAPSLVSPRPSVLCAYPFGML